MCCKVKEMYRSVTSPPTRDQTHIETDLFRQEQPSTSVPKIRVGGR
jgi:hypothetical protein